MLSFEQYLETIMEAKGGKKPPKEKSFNLNDAKGKLYEILAGSHFQHGTHKSGIPNDLLTHYRDEEGKSPQDVHNYIKKELDARYPGLYNEINKHAIEGAIHLRNELSKYGHNNINDTAWTSQEGDHKKFTGEDDPNSDADIMLKGNRGPVGISMKYGKNKDMNLRNNGLDELENMAGLEKNALSKLRENHQKYVSDLGIENHEHYKKLRDSSNPVEKEIANKAEKSALNTQKQMAKKMSEGLAARAAASDGNEFLKQYVKNRIAPKTKFQHFRLHTRPNEKGEATHHISDMQDDSNKLENFEHFRVVPHTGSISFKIEGKRKGSESYEPVLDQVIKKGNGPMKGFASTTKAPFLTKKDKGKELILPKKQKAIISKMVNKTPDYHEDEDRFTNEGGPAPRDYDNDGTWGGSKFRGKTE